jgi:hypothetical protein
VNTPQFPAAFSSIASSLGALKRYFPARDLTRVGNLVAFFFFVGGSVLVLLYGLFNTFAAYQKHGPALIDDGLTAPLTIACIMLVLGLAAGRAAYVNWNRAVAVYERGFAFRDRKGVQTWRWEEIISLTGAVTRHYIAGIYTGTTHIFSLINLRSQRLIFTDTYANVEELVKAIQDAIYPILYERAARQYNAGQMLVFGPVAISQAGIRIGKNTCPWTDVQQVSIRRGILTVSKNTGGWFSGASASASVIPNPDVLLNIIHQVVGLKVD